MERRRIYMDQAATSWPKLPAAVEAASDFVSHCGATAGRGVYHSAQQAERWLGDARHAMAKLINAATSDCIAFCSSGTHALNAGLSGLLARGDHVVTTAIEHNSVLRPLRKMEIESGIEWTAVACDSTGSVDVDDIARAVRPNTRMLVVGHASNVTGRIQRLEPIGALARRIDVPLLVDASQTLGYIPIDVQKNSISLLAAAGHKGLRALPGTGLLYVERTLQTSLRPLMVGGTGVHSEDIDARPGWPQVVEVGNLNMPGVVSMCIGARQADVSRGWQGIFGELVAGLGKLSGLRIIGCNDLSANLPVVSLVSEGWDVHDLANVLDASFGIEVRSGLHCAALIHSHLGTAPSGTLRISLGHDTTSAEVAWVIEALQTMMGGSE